MTLNGVIALILRYFTEFYSFGADYVTAVKDRPMMFVFQLHLAKTDPRSSRTVSLRQLSFLLVALLSAWRVADMQGAAATPLPLPAAS